MTQKNPNPEVPVSPMPEAPAETEALRTQKAALHKTMRARQKALPADYRRRASDRIQDAVLASPRYRQAESILLYLHMPTEPATDRLVARALADGKRVYVPKCVGPGQMIAVRIRDTADLVPGAYGIPEPRDLSQTAGAAEMDLIIVPCLSAARDGRRLGHGAGYYDRFLAGYGERTLCLCFERMLCGEIPVTALDVRMAEVCTEGPEDPAQP